MAETALAHPRLASGIGLVLGAVISVQFGAALAATLFDDVGAVAVVFLRLTFAALMLLLLWRPTLRGHSKADLRVAAVFGLTLAAMNVSFYTAIDRIPLGVAVTFEFIGPLGVAVAASRSAVDLAWVGIAAGGIALLSGGIGGDLDPVGVVLALLAGGFWAAYILLSVRIGRLFPGGGGLAVALALAALVVAPAGIAEGGGALLSPLPLLVGAAVALLSTAIPSSFEIESLRRMPAGVFGVLMSLEPAVAALAGLAVLSQSLEWAEVLAIGLVVLASAGAAWGARARVTLAD
jgi:inner membrane transporter RhtA